MKWITKEDRYQNNKRTPLSELERGVSFDYK